MCRPGFNASCALCCGSHNYDAEPLEIEKLFSKRRKIFSYYSRKYIINRIVSSRSDLTGSYYYTEEKHPFILSKPPLHKDTLQCPYVTVVDDNITIGCYLYPEGVHGSRNLDCFNAYRSKRFLCRAMDTLTDEEVLYAARLTGDWYYYSILIHHHSFLKKLMDEHPEPGCIDETGMIEISRELKNHCRENRHLHNIHTYL